MAVDLATLIQRTRRFVGDWPDNDVLTASLASTTSVVSVGDGTLYYKNLELEIDQELLKVQVAGAGTTFTARRGAHGSTAASHASTAVVLMNPAFPAVQVIDALNMAKDDAYPLHYMPVLDTSLTTLANTFEYTVPNMPGTYGGDTIPMQYVSKVEVKGPGQTDYIPIRQWNIRRASTPKIQFKHVQEAGGTIRVHGYGPFPDLSATTDVLSDKLWRKPAEKFLPVGAASFLLAGGEARRTRVDTLATDNREMANRPGSAMSASNALYARFRQMVLTSAPPALPPHVKPTF